MSVGLDTHSGSKYPLWVCEAGLVPGVTWKPSSVFVASRSTGSHLEIDDKTDLRLGHAGGGRSLSF